jgi:hypothetical protein
VTSGSHLPRLQVEATRVDRIVEIVERLAGASAVSARGHMIDAHQAAVAEPDCRHKDICPHRTELAAVASMQPTSMRSMSRRRSIGEMQCTVSDHSSQSPTSSETGWPDSVVPAGSQNYGTRPPPDQQTPTKASAQTTAFGSWATWHCCTSGWAVNKELQGGMLLGSA